MQIEEYYGSNLDYFFDEWVFKGTGRPKYEYSWKFEDFQGQKGSGAYTVRLNLKQVQKDDGSGISHEWTFPPKV